MSTSRIKFCEKEIFLINVNSDDMVKSYFGKDFMRNCSTFPFDCYHETSTKVAFVSSQEKVNGDCGERIHLEGGFIKTNLYFTMVIYGFQSFTMPALFKSVRSLFENCVASKLDLDWTKIKILLFISLLTIYLRHLLH